MNRIYSSCHEVSSLDHLKDLVRMKMDVFWRFKLNDPDVSFRLVPDYDKTGFLFKEDNNVVF